MDTEQAVLALASATEALVLDHDTSGFLADLLDGCQRVLAADASGVLSATTGMPLQLLAASTHASAELELHQSQTDEGPCVDAAEGGRSVAVCGDDELRARWPRFAETMIGAGFHAVHSAPLRWRSHTLGAMALFRRDARAFTAAEDRVAQAFADITTLLIVHSDPVDLSQVKKSVKLALSTRVVIEQAKGVVAERDGVAMEQAYQLLLRQAATQGRALTDVAKQTLEDAASRRVP